MSVPHVAIAIATFRRPAGLARLLASLDRLTFVAIAEPRITMVIVDNDELSTLTEADRQSRFPVRYAVEPRRGLAAVRNACLDATPADCNFVVFVDDDEWVEPDWLERLLDMQARTGAEIVQGVVRPVYTQPAPDWMRDGGYHEVGPFADGAPLFHGASGNILIERTAIERSGARFHAAFDASGGEDVDFFNQLLARGCRIIAANHAIAYEDVPADRMTLAWVLRRRYRTGHTLGLVARRQGGWAARLAKALARGGAGSLEALFGLLTSRTRAVRGLTNVAWSLGTFAGLMLGRPLTRR